MPPICLSDPHSLKAPQIAHVHMRYTKLPSTPLSLVDLQGLLKALTHLHRVEHPNSRGVDLKILNKSSVRIL